MSTPINAVLYVDQFTPTGLPGEYSFTNAAFNNQTDRTGNGAFDVQPGFILSVQAIDPNTATAIPGLFHRYKLTKVAAVDSGTLSGVMVWDGDGDEEDAPANGAPAVLAEVTPRRHLALLTSEAIYNDLPAGAGFGSLMTDVKKILDKPDEDSTKIVMLRKDFTEDDNEWIWLHEQGTSTFQVSLYNYDGTQFFAGVKAVDGDMLQVFVAQPTHGYAVGIFTKPVQP